MKRVFAVGAAWNALSTWVEQVVGALVFLIIARLIGVEDFGVAAMAFAFLFLGEFLVRNTVTEAIVAQHELEDGRLEATFVALTGFSIAVVLALAVVAGLVAAAYGQPSVAPLLTAASPTVLLIAAAGVSTALLRRALAYRVLALQQMVGVAAGGIVGVVMAAYDCGAWSLVGQRLVEIGINSALAVHAARWLPRRWPRRSDFALLRGLAPRVVLLRALTLAINQTPTVALGLFAGPLAAGLFAMGARLIEMVGFLIVKPLQGAAQPAFAAMRRQHAPTAPFYLELNELAGLGAFTAFAGLALIADPLIGLLLGDKWRDAAAVLPWLCLGGAVAALTAIQEAYLLALGRLDAFLKASVLELALGLVLVMVAAPHGPVAVAAAVALRALAVVLVRAAAALAPEAIRPGRLARALASPLAVAGGVAAAVGLWRLAAFHRTADLVFVASAVAIGLAAAAALLFGPMRGAAARLRTFIQAES